MTTLYIILGIIALAFVAVLYLCMALSSEDSEQERRDR